MNPFQVMILTCLWHSNKGNSDW